MSQYSQHVKRGKAYVGVWVDRALDEEIRSALARIPFPISRKAFVTRALRLAIDELTTLFPKEQQ